MIGSREGATRVGGVPGADVLEGAALAAPHDHASIEARWQAVWAERGAFAAPSAADESCRAYVFAHCPVADGGTHIEQVRGYAIADAYARFMRARGRATLFSVGFACFGASVELEARRQGVAPATVVTDGCEDLQARLQRLGLGCDWSRSFVSSDPEHYRWTQWLFLLLLEHGFLYTRETPILWCGQCSLEMSATVDSAVAVAEPSCPACGNDLERVDGERWFMRRGALAKDGDSSIEAPPGWCEQAADTQRELLGRVDGVELEAMTLDGRSLTAFTDHPGSVAEASFIAISPSHPEIDIWLSDGEATAVLAGSAEASDEAPVMSTGALAMVPGVANMLPIVVSSLVERRFGSTAALGIPSADTTDASIAAQLPDSAGGAWRASQIEAHPRQAVRYRIGDLPISRSGSWGPPVPLIHCSDCGVVPVAAQDLPVQLPEEVANVGQPGQRISGDAEPGACLCPRCVRPATRDVHTIDCRLDEMWRWAAICVPAEDRSSAMFAHPECARWMPAERVVAGSDAAERILEARLLARFLHRAGELPALPGGEPFADVLLHGMVRSDGRSMSPEPGEEVDAGRLVDDVGADTLRVALLYAAAPAGSFAWSEDSVRASRRFLERLYAYALPRLDEWAATSDGAPQIDTSEKLGRRLAHWCDVACEKVTADLERLAMQRATRDVMRFLTRIEDFEHRVLEGHDGELRDADRQSIAAALRVLVTLLAPFAPHMAQELWSGSAVEQRLILDQPWPDGGRATTSHGGKEDNPTAVDARP